MHNGKPDDPLEILYKGAYLSKSFNTMKYNSYQRCMALHIIH